MRHPRTAAVVAAAVLFAGACGASDEETSLVLDGRARPPDGEGVVTAVSHAELTLDGDRTYDVSSELQSFSTATLEPLPLVGREGQYVHLGLKGETVVWIAAVGGVLPGDPPLAYYEGTVAETADTRVVFEDGTVLRLDADVEAPEEGQDVLAEIDVDRDRVRAITAHQNDS